MRNGVVVLMVLLSGCGSCSDFFARPDAGTPPATTVPPAPVALDQLPVAPQHCTDDPSARLDDEDEALITTLRGLTPAAQRVVEKRFTCVLPSVALYFEYASDDAARRASYRIAPRVFQGQVPIPTLRPFEVLRRGNVLAVLLGPSAPEFGTLLATQRQFEPAIPGSSALTPPTGHSSSWLPFMYQVGPPAIDDGGLSVVELACTADASLVCPAVAGFRELRAVDPPRSEPEVYVGLCRTKQGERWVERACWLLWSPIGIAMGDISALPEGVRTDAATEARLRSASPTAPREAAPDALREAVIDLGPGARSELSGLTRRVAVSDQRSLSVRANEHRIVVVETDRMLRAQSAGVF